MTILSRRSRTVMRELHGKMRELAALGKTRKEIAAELACTPAQVTKGLGPARAWRERRIAAEVKAKGGACANASQAVPLKP